MCVEYKMCLDRVLPREKWSEAIEKALAENPENMPGQIAAPRVGAVPLSLSQPQAVLFVGKKWQNGRTLRVCFLQGHPAVKEKVIEYASEWMKYANIRFEFVNDPRAEIRITFRQGDGSWSYLGTDALTIPQNQPTMNYGWLTPTTPDDEYSRVVLHEFGHALAMPHEHSHPDHGIPWDREAVYSYYARQGWSRQQVDQQVFEVVPRSQTQFTHFDPRSIMCYPVPNELTIGNYEVGWNRTLSPTDREFIASVYPKATAEPSELEIDGPPQSHSIGRHQEVDNFRFTVSTGGRYTLETAGQTDVVMSLYGPDSDSRLIAEDDDTGEGRNARIVQNLAAGKYLVRVRHHSPRGTGSYKIRLTQTSRTALAAADGRPIEEEEPFVVQPYIPS